ncbi:MAG: helix-turn-helix transcriptional regulator [Bacteroidetes bacterium]|nr:helix-turn-helix transcriptional regulator [Bacteroidota bacterium]
MAKTNDPTHKFLAAVGARIRYYRNKKGLSLITLGDQIGLDKGNMHHIESGKNITIETLLKIAVFVGVNPAKLVDTNTTVRVKDVERLIVKSNRRKPKRKKAAKKKSSRKK